MTGLAEGLTKLKVHTVMLNGKMKMEDRQASVDAFQLGDARVFVGGIQSAGTGITLTSARTLIFAEQDWTPGNMAQAGDRIHRIGQENAVLLQHIIMEDSLDSKMMNRTVDKQESIDVALDLECLAPVEEDSNPPDTVQVAAKAPKKTPYREIGKEMTSDQKDVARKCLLELVKFDSDRATVANGLGFSKIDSDIGHQLAALEGWSDGQAGFAKHLSNKYRKQLPEKYTSLLK